jgi:SNF2 family DNA or RNA helicase
LYSQIRAVNKKIFKSAKEYDQRYCEPEKKFNSRTNLFYNARSCCLDELKLLLEREILIRRDKLDYPEFFVKKQIEVHRLSLEIDKDTINKFNRDVLKFLQKKRKKQNKRKLKSEIGKTCEKKLIPACLYINNLLVEETISTKIVVVAFHLKMLDALECISLANNHNYIRIDGTTSFEERELRLQKFKTDSSVKVAFISLLTMESISLNGVFFLNNSFKIYS